MATTALALPTTVSGVKKELRAAQTMRRSLARMKEESKALAHAVGTTLEVNAAAFAFGVVHGKFGEVKIAGVAPVSLSVGLCFYAVGMLAGRGYGSHAKAVGDGCVAAFSTLFGVGVGQRLGTESQGLAGDLGADVPFGGPSQGGGHLNDQEMAAIAESL